jgi:hypothetical protein
MNQHERKICDDRIRSSKLQTTEDVECYIHSARQLPLTQDSEVLIVLLECLNAIEAGEVQYELIEAAERFPDEMYVRTVLPRAGEIVRRAEDWGWMLIQSILNTKSCLDVAIDWYRNLDVAAKREFDAVLSKLCERDHRYSWTGQTFKGPSHWSRPIAVSFSFRVFCSFFANALPLIANQAAKWPFHPEVWARRSKLFSTPLLNERKQRHQLHRYANSMSIQAVRPMWHVYVRKGTGFVPNVAQTEAGFFLDVEPVRVAKLDALPSLASAIEQAMVVGNPLVSTPSRAAFPKPVILKFAGVKNWNAFVERGVCFTLFRGEAELELTETARNDDGEWTDAPSLNQKLPLASTASDIARRIIARVNQRSDLAW